MGAREHRAEHLWTGVRESIVALWGDDAAATLPAGASEQALEDCSRLTGIAIPGDIKDIYRMHDGGAGLMQIVDIVETWQFLSSLPRKHSSGKIPTTGHVMPTPWSAAWLPIAADGAGNYKCIDFRPARGGHEGQIVAYYHDDLSRAVVASSVFEYVLGGSWLEWAWATFGPPRP